MLRKRYYLKNLNNPKNTIKLNYKTKVSKINQYLYYHYPSLDMDLIYYTHQNLPILIIYNYYYNLHIHISHNYYINCSKNHILYFHNYHDNHYNNYYNYYTITINLNLVNLGLKFKNYLRHQYFLLLIKIKILLPL